MRLKFIKMVENKFRNFDEKINYRKIFLKKHKKGLNQSQLKFRVGFSEDSKKVRQYPELKNVLDNCVLNFSRISDSKQNLKLYFLGILVGVVGSVFFLYFQSKTLFSIVLGTFVLISIYVIFIWLKKNNEAQVFYWMYLKTIEELKLIGVDYSTRE